MSLSFCPKCNNILIPEKKDNKYMGKCSYCGYLKKMADRPVITREKMVNKKLGTKIQKEKNEFATYHHKCQKCGYDKAQIIDMGIFYSDEDNLILLRCGKCGWSERIGKKTT